MVDAAPLMIIFSRDSSLFCPLLFRRWAVKCKTKSLRGAEVVVLAEGAEETLITGAPSGCRERFNACNPDFRVRIQGLWRKGKNNQKSSSILSVLISSHPTFYLLHPLLAAAGENVCNNSLCRLSLFASPRSSS